LRKGYVDHRLRGVFAKLDRADTYLETLEAFIEGFLDEKPYRVISKPDPETGECVFYGKVRKRPPLTQWALLIGDTTQNMRNALDHLAWQLALLNRPNETPPSNTAFPIYDDETKYLDAIGGRRSPIRGLSDEVQARIAELQPWYRTKRPWADPLWILHRLANDDKHRLLHLSYVGGMSASYFVREGIGSPLDAAGLMALITFQDDVELGRLPPKAVPDCAEVANEIQVRYDVAFDQKGPGRGERVVRQLERCRTAVRGDVIPRFLDLFES
jgi:hypothetical protein